MVNPESSAGQPGLVRCLAAFFVLVMLLSNTVAVQVFSDEQVSFQSGDITLYGSLLKPEGQGIWPAIVLVHGAGLGQRDAVRPVAEAFAREGFIAFIYDKRTEGYSATPVMPVFTWHRE